MKAFSALPPITREVFDLIVEQRLAWKVKTCVSGRLPPM
jgi:hypothetical protein